MFCAFNSPGQVVRAFSTKITGVLNLKVVQATGTFPVGVLTINQAFKSDILYDHLELN